MVCAAACAAATSVKPLSGSEEQRDHGDAESQPRKDEIGQKRNRAFTETAQITANTNDSVEGGIHKCAAVEAMTGQRVFSPALRAVVRTVAIRIGDLVEVTLDGDGAWM